MPGSGNPTHMKTEGGLTLVELLVATVILGSLAAVAVPTFLGQKNKGSDAEAKSAVITATRAMEACATEHGGNYSSCSRDALVAAEPSLGDLDARLGVNPGSNNYEIAVVAIRDASVRFTLSRSADGTTSRSCSIGSVERGGCLAPSTGTW